MLIHRALLQNQMIKLKSKTGTSRAQFDCGSINKPNKKLNCKVSFRLSEYKSRLANEVLAPDGRQWVAPKGSFALGAHTKENAVRSPQCSENTTHAYLVLTKDRPHKYASSSFTTIL